MSLTLILKLASSTTGNPKDEFITENMSAEIAEALKAMMNDEKKETAKQAAHEIMNLLRAASATEETIVESIRKFRRLEAAAKAQLDRINLAKKYAKESNNYAPLALTLNPQIGFTEEYQGNKQLFLIPESFANPTKIEVEKKQEKKNPKTAT